MKEIKETGREGQASVSGTWFQGLLWMVNKGFLHLLSANILNKVLLFLTTIIVVRLLSKEVYGTWAYANNILNFFMLFNGLGAVQGVLQFGSAAQGLKREEALHKGLALGIVSNLALSLTILLSTFLFSLPVKGSTDILRALAFIPLLTGLFQILLIYKRVLLLNRSYSFFAVLQTGLHLILMAVLGYWGGLTGIIAGKYLALAVALGALGFSLRMSLPGVRAWRGFVRQIDRAFFKFCVTVSLTNSASSALYLVDTLLIGIILKDSVEIASYRVSSSIPFALNVISATVIMFAYPYFVRMAGDLKKAKRYFFKLQGGIALFQFFLTGALFLFAPIIVRFIYGGEYNDSVEAFRVLLLGYFFVSAVRIPGGNFIASQLHVRFNLILTGISGVGNILLDIFLIGRYGRLGAAMATSTVFILSSLAIMVYITVMKPKVKQECVPD
ncbi:MAG TPA: oligosaccharide flippase family protein [Candidatus Mcinerneyibacteriales bacterium]|nr:oligosaccharide flippase family protein [Candidatus Mcinerneyibacteriales bacterium]